MSTDEFDLTVTDAFETPGRRKNNFTATTTPSATDDWDPPTSLYEVGSVWVNTTTDTAYICVDSTDDAAVWQAIGGAGSGDTSLFVDTSVSGAHTIDHDDGSTHDLTLTGDATFTLDGSFTGETTDLRVILRQDGTGGRTVTWPGSVDWVGGSAPTLQTAADAFDVIGLLTVDDGTTWIGFHAGSGVDLSAINFLVGTASGLLSGEIAVGTTPGGELGGTWASPTVDATHSGSTHSDATDAHIADATDAHDASAISIVDAGTYYTSTDVEGALQEIGAGGIGGGSGGGHILIADEHSTPLVFDDLLQNDDGDDLLYADA